MKEVLVSDIDEVLAKLFVDLNNFYNKIYRTNFKLEDYVHYDLEKVWGGSKKRAVEIVIEFYKSPEFDEIKPMEFSQEAIKILSRGYNIIAVTSRPDFMKEKTEEWVYKHYPDVKEILFTGMYDKKFIEMSKLDICLKKNAKLIVDDHPLIIQECAEHGLVSFLFGRGNDFIYEEKLERTNGGIPVKNWKEVLDHLNINHSRAEK